MNDSPSNYISCPPSFFLRRSRGFGANPYPSDFAAFFSQALVPVQTFENSVFPRVSRKVTSSRREKTCHFAVFVVFARFPHGYVSPTEYSFEVLTPFCAVRTITNGYTSRMEYWNAEREFLSTLRVLHWSCTIDLLIDIYCIRSSHKFVPFFERLYMLRLFTYLSVSWKNVIPLSLYNFFPFFKCIGPLSPYVYKSTHEMYTQKSARTYGMT